MAHLRVRPDLRASRPRFCPKLSAYGIPPGIGATIVQGGPITEPALYPPYPFRLAPPPGASPKMAWIFRKLRTYSQNGNLLFPSLGFVVGDFLKGVSSTPRSRKKPRREIKIPEYKKSRSSRISIRNDFIKVDECVKVSSPEVLFFSLR